MRKKLTILHTTLATTTTIPARIRELYPDEFDIVNVLDDSLLNDIKYSGRMSASVIERFIQYACIAKNNGSDALLLACSSLGKAADIARELLDIPLYKIDEPMADQAVNSGNNILVLGTVKSTLEPTSDLIRSKRKSQEQSITCILIPDVFELYEIDREQHDQRIAEVIQEHLNTYDVIVLAQASMANAIQYITQGREKIVTSLPLGLQQLKEI
ncbi:aspartate/glutamate racemase family protein [[Clostridium] innocuum]|uniref:aspartate/glutamate racemase family protein n=1 Tax=Clostridium innocuum TaxID=1522 RepID=UPI0021478212|nr:aspartate/glutamate racemase family protein [[Clostridium] innocuum]MCR0274224.1 aspartate/glutamate racemase family protein [[Clostridium] innocuum]